MKNISGLAVYSIKEINTDTMFNKTLNTCTFFK